MSSSLSQNELNKLKEEKKLEEERVLIESLKKLIDSGDIDSVTKILKEKAGAFYTHSLGEKATALHWVACLGRGYSQLVPLLLKNDPSLINKTDGGIFDQPAFHVAMRYRSHAVAEELLKAEGMDPNITGSEGDTALISAAKFHSPSLPISLVYTLIQKGANIQAVNKAGESALSHTVFASEKGSSDFAQLLLSMGAKVDPLTARLQEYWYSTLLHNTIKFSGDPNGILGLEKRGLLAILPILMQHGLDIRATDSDNKTAFDVARTDNEKIYLRILPLITPLFTPKNLQEIADNITKSYLKDHTKETVKPDDYFLQDRKWIEETLTKELSNNSEALKSLFAKYDSNLEKAAKSLEENKERIKEIVSDVLREHIYNLYLSHQGETVLRPFKPVKPLIHSQQKPTAQPNKQQETKEQHKPS